MYMTSCQAPWAHANVLIYSKATTGLEASEEPGARTNSAF